HVLPGIDDGPETLEESVALARVAVDAGIDTLVATPHVNSRTPNDSATIARLVDTLNQRLDEEHVDLEVLPGGEVAISHLAEIEPQELSRLGLGGGPWLLVEPPFTPVAVGLAGMVQGVQRLGHRVVLAHPERCPALQRDRQTVRALAEGGVLMSITAGSLTGRFGNEVRRFALELAREGLIHNVTSDAHDSVRRPPGLAEQIEHAGLGPLLEWLTQMVPAAILAGEEMPPRPAAARDGARRRRGWRLRR
ncbi:MAG: tyrosine-protein phosphatase, partial [Solirubrobacteraceae bacterium]